MNVELGTEKLDIRDFLMDDIFEGDFITDVSVINLKEPGTHAFKVDGMIFITIRNR